MNKPKNLKSRDSTGTMKPLEGVKLDTFSEVEQRGWGRVRALNKSNSEIVLDWRMQWGDTDKNKANRQQQLFSLSLKNIGKNDELVISRQELERILRHV